MKEIYASQLDLYSEITIVRKAARVTQLSAAPPTTRKTRKKNWSHIFHMVGHINFAEAHVECIADNMKYTDDASGRKLVYILRLCEKGILTFI